VIGPLEDPPTARTLWTVRSRKGCLTCNHPLRWALEREMVAGRTWAAIVRDLPEDAGLTGRNLRDHFAAGHLPVFEPAVQEHVTRQSRVRGEAVPPSVAKLADTLGFAQTVVTRVSERLIAGDVQPSICDGLAAAEHLLRYAPVDTGYDEEATLAAFVEYHDTARAILDDETWTEFSRGLRTNPTLNALVAQYSDRKSGRRVPSWVGATP